MNEEVIEKMLKSKKVTYNDLDDREFVSLIEKFISCNFLTTDSKNMWLLLKFLEESKKIDWKEDELKSDHRWEDTRFKFTGEVLMIPVSLNRIMEYLISRDLKVEGIFKRSPQYSKIQEAITDFNICIQRKEDLEERIGKYDTLEIASVFKEILGAYNHAIIPSGFVKYLCQIQRSKISEKEKIRALRILLFQLPRSNLDVLQSVIAYIRIIHGVFSQYSTKWMKQIGLDGFSAVITPRLIASTKITDIQDIIHLADIIIFMTQNFEQIISILEIH